MVRFKIDKDYANLSKVIGQGLADSTYIIRTCNGNALRRTREQLLKVPSRPTSNVTTIPNYDRNHSDKSALPPPTPHKAVSLTPVNPSLRETTPQHHC